MIDTPQAIQQIAAGVFAEFMPIAMIIKNSQLAPDEQIEEGYLKRWWLAKIVGEHDLARLGELKDHTRATPDFNLYLHHMSGSDKRIRHNHPWPNASLILEGELDEDTPVGIFRRKPGQLVYRRAEELHRLELVDGPVWTLFLTGKKVQEWGFQRRDGSIAPWREVSEVGPDGIQRYTGEETA